MNTIKKIIRTALPLKFRVLIYELTPKFQPTNTYMLNRTNKITDLSAIDKKFFNREIPKKDVALVAKAYGQKGFVMNTILPRLKDSSWVGLAVIDETTQNIAYISWIIRKNIPFINEFSIFLNRNQFFLRHGYCVPVYRHQGLHTRMEQERINYCIHNGATEIFIQIGSNNMKGQKSVLDNGFKFYQKNTIIRIPRFGVYQELNSFLKNPFMRVV